MSKAGYPLVGMNAAVREVRHFIIPAEDGAAPLYPQIKVTLEADEKVLAHSEPVCGESDALLNVVVLTTSRSTASFPTTEDVTHPHGDSQDTRARRRTGSRAAVPQWPAHRPKPGEKHTW